VKRSRSHGAKSSPCRLVPRSEFFGELCYVNHFSSSPVPPSLLAWAARPWTASAVNRPNDLAHTWFIHYGSFYRKNYLESRTESNINKTTKSPLILCSKLFNQTLYSPSQSVHSKVLHTLSSQSVITYETKHASDLWPSCSSC